MLEDFYERKTKNLAVIQSFKADILDFGAWFKCQFQFEWWHPCCFSGVIEAWALDKWFLDWVHQWIACK